MEHLTLNNKEYQTVISPQERAMMLIKRLEDAKEYSSEFLLPGIEHAYALACTLFADEIRINTAK